MSGRTGRPNYDAEGTPCRGDQGGPFFWFMLNTGVSARRKRACRRARSFCCLFGMARSGWGTGGCAPGSELEKTHLGSGSECSWSP